MLCDEAPLYLLATGSTLTGITILLIVLYFLQRRLKYYYEKVGVSFGQKLMPGEAWGEELYWLSKDVKRWRIIIGVLLCICCFAQFCIHLWGSIKIFGKIFLHCTEVRFSRLCSGGFITAIVVNPSERKLAKGTSVHCPFRWISQVKTNYQIPVFASIFGRNRKEKGQPYLISFQLQQQYKSKQWILVFSHCLIQRKGQMS